MGYNVRNVLSQLPAWGHGRGGGGGEGGFYLGGNGQNGEAAFCIHLTNFCSPSLPFVLLWPAQALALNCRAG